LVFPATLQSVSAVQFASQRPSGPQTLPAAHWVLDEHFSQTWVVALQWGREASAQSVEWRSP
jgi:hypothetical protein